MTVTEGFLIIKQKKGQTKEIIIQKKDLIYILNFLFVHYLGG